MKLSHMKECDIATVYELECKCFSTPWSISSLKTDLKDENSYYIVCKNENNIVGYGGIKFILDEAEIMNIAVDENFRKCGIANRILENIIDKCREENIISIYLEVRKGNQAANKLYINNNFKTVGCRKNYYSNPKEDAILMKRLI